MDDAGGVGFGDRVARLQHVVDGLANGQCAAIREARHQVLALEVLHDDVRRLALEPPDIEDAYGVLAAQCARGLGLADEAGHGIAVVQHLGQHHLDRDAALELEVSCRKDVTHPARADHTLDAIFFSDDVARLEMKLAALAGRRRRHRRRQVVAVRGSVARGARGTRRNRRRASERRRSSAPRARHPRRASASRRWGSGSGPASCPPWNPKRITLFRCDPSGRRVSAG